jgi:Ca2+-binding EF-hand superfamily protein
MNGIMPPQREQVLQTMRTFDKDGNGLLDFNEFRILLCRLNNLPC